MHVPRVQGVPHIRGLVSNKSIYYTIHNPLMAKQIATILGEEEAIYVERARIKSGLSMYTFVKNAVMLASERELEEVKVPSPIIEQMIEALTERKRYIYQVGPYTDGNHRDWLEGRFTQATKRQVTEAVAQWRAAGGKT